MQVEIASVVSLPRNIEKDKYNIVNIVQILKLLRYAF
jgi:hypothetical protein